MQETTHRGARKLEVCSATLRLHFFNLLNYFTTTHFWFCDVECVGEIYSMWFDAVYLYADINHANYDVMKFCLPMVAPANPANEGGVIAPPPPKGEHKYPCGGRMMRRRRRMTMITLLRPNKTNCQPANASTNKKSNNQPWLSFWCRVWEWRRCWHCRWWQGNEQWCLPHGGAN